MSNNKLSQHLFYNTRIRRCKPLVDPITDAPSRSATLALSRRDQVNQTFSFFHVRDQTKQVVRPRPTRRTISSQPPSLFGGPNLHSISF
uniref:Uncharacterized protein n=1 Tax=Brassica oleracea TaxID=3712 RepID=A0A3P6GWQ0_BRAOL|nr:unnamed protein product [Brassica oleracea]